MKQRSNTENPYLAARAEWNERYGSFVSQARIWQGVGVLSLTLAIVATGYALYLGSQSRIIPYVVEVDRLGNAQAGTYAPSVQYTEERVIEAAIADFISNWRGVTVDGRLQKDRINKLYSYLSSSDAATAKLNTYFREQGGDPFKRAKTRTVSVGVHALNRISDQSYQVDWSEVEYDREGYEQGRRRFRAIISIAIIPPATEQLILQNPVGLYVTDYDLTEITS